MKDITSQVTFRISMKERGQTDIVHDGKCIGVVTGGQAVVTETGYTLEYDEDKFGRRKIKILKEDA